MPAVIQPVISTLHTGQWTMQMVSLSVSTVHQIYFQYFLSSVLQPYPSGTTQLCQSKPRARIRQNLNFCRSIFANASWQLFCGGREGGNQFQSRPARCTSSLYGNTNPDITLTPAKHVNSESRRLPIVQFGTETKYWARATNIQ